MKIGFFVHVRLYYNLSNIKRAQVKVGLRLERRYSQR